MSIELVEAAQELREKAGGFWGAHPNHSVEDWQYEVANGDTRLGYWEWCVGQVEMAEHDAAAETHDSLQSHAE